MTTKPEKSDPIPVEMKAHNSPWTEIFRDAQEDDKSAAAPAASQPETSQSGRAERASDTAADSDKPTRDALSTIFNR